MKKLLATTSIMALAASPALADLTFTFDAAAGDLDAPISLAEEVDLTGANTTTVNFSLTTDGTIAAGSNLFLTVNISGGTFTSALSGAEFTGGVDAASINSGGAKGGSSVRYLIDTDGGGAISEVTFDLPITYGGCPTDLSADVSEFETEVGGTPIEGGTAAFENGLAAPASTTHAITCVDAFQASVVDDSTVAGGIDSVLDFGATPALVDFFPTAGGGPAAPLIDPDTTSAADLGFLLLEVDTTAVSDIDGSDTAVDPADADACDIDITFPGGIDGLVSLDLNPGAGGDTLFDSGGAEAIAAATEALDCDVADATNATEEGGIRLVIDGTDVPALQQPTCTGSLDLLTPLYVATDPFLACALDDLDPNSVNVGPFDWVGDKTKGTRNIFRVTGVGTSLPQVDVEITNTTGGTNVSCTLDLTGKSADELIINANDISDSGCGNFGRGDVTFKFFMGTPVASSFDVDRLLATGGDNIVSGFGNDGIVDSDSADGDDD